MKRFCVFACLCLICVVLMADTALAGDVSSTAISLDLAAGSVEIYESEGITYCVQNGETQATTGGVIIRQTDSGSVATANTVTVSGGSCKVTISSLNIEAEDYESPILVVNGASLDLTLLGSSTVTGGECCAGIQVPDGAAITIGGSGSITATGRYTGAGIGGGYNSADGSYNPNYGTITINGGTVNANGGYHSAGIGSGNNGGYGTIIINGGTVTANGGFWGAGIGGYLSDLGGTITINGGTVNANSDSGDGINCDAITINGGTVNANSEEDSGIFSKDVTITGGVVNAVTRDAYRAGIAGIKGGNITIAGGTITAECRSSRGFDVAGIGGDDCRTIIITDGTIVVGGKVGACAGGTCDGVTISEEVIITTKHGYAPAVIETIFIDKKPLSSTAHLNSRPKVSVIARGHSGLSYQWQLSSDNKYWTDLEGETASATASFVMSEELDGAYLRCALTNGWGNVRYTDAVQIYVLAFAQQPTSVEANLNDMVAFEATSTCSNVTYQWQRSYDDGATWSNVDGETFSPLIVNATLSESSAKYRCVITATNGDWLASDVVSVNLDLGDLVTYTVQDFMQDTDGNGYTMMGQQVLEGLSGTSVTAPTEGHDGFTLNTGKSILSGTVAEDNSLVLTRYFDRNTYSITFDINGGSALPEMEALYGAPIEAPSAPVRYGHIFDGWYADENLTEEYIFDTMPLGGATVYAKWAPVGSDRGIEYKINDLSIRDIDTFEPLEDIPEDDFLVEVSVTNLEATETDTILLVYYTDEGQMLGMNYMFANTPVGYTATFGASVDNNNGNIGIIRAFVLPSLGNPIPLANSAEIK